MKIVFICGSLEPGKDGVGDYTRRLAAALHAKGSNISIIALNDKYISSTTVEFQSVDGIEVSVLRITSGLTSRRRKLVLTKKWIEERNPEWVSLQFVPFAFHPKGFVFGLGKMLKDLGKENYWHLMVHELWVGMAKEESLKLKLWGKIQYYFIESFLHTLQPKVINTQSHLYLLKINKMGYKASYLPLFSNIPVLKFYSSEASVQNKSVSLVLFGIIHKRAPIEFLAQEALEYTKKNNKCIHLTLIGKNGSEQGRWVKIWKEKGLPIEILGEQSPETISRVLHHATAGLATTAYAVVEKSGSFAALHAHGLPVLCLSPQWTPVEIDNIILPKGVVNYKPGNLKTFLQQKKFEFNSDVNNVAEQLKNNLEVFKISNKV